MDDQSIGAHYLEDARRTFRDYKKLAERAFEQIDDADFFRTIDDESNSIAVNMKHMAGNMISRWTDFLTTDGEKPERDRDMEFVMLPHTTKAEMIAYWDKGWKCVFDAVARLTADDLPRTVTIRGQDHTVVEAINRQIAHYAYHVGQIVYLAKHFKASTWQTLSVPNNKSEALNKYLAEKTNKASSASREERLDEVTEFASKNHK